MNKKSTILKTKKKGRLRRRIGETLETRKGKERKKEKNEETEAKNKENGEIKEEERERRDWIFHCCCHTMNF